ncbi:ankyrin repeat and LEM domain-containing protein 1 [Ahaetulla prasina]|uniref:ankyrin repeat and LEM domain-containing protein 1 n=1 Tax=Ahaetulla prasina TaxID=499056 RepID=UPI00264943AA|nr:ankyrin repeat and LEM domain-containing protein 1 [Ahaetulla prasina]
MKNSEGSFKRREQDGGAVLTSWLWKLWLLTTDRDEFATAGRDALTRPLSPASRPPQHTDRPAPPPPGGDVRRRSARWGRSAHAWPRLAGTGVPLPFPRPPPSGAMKHSALQLAARLCRALRGQDDAMVAALLLEGADPNLVLPEGVAPMHLAAGLEQQNGIRRLRLLLQHGGDPNARSAEGLTPLHVAASWGCTACLRLLLTEGGDPHLEDQDGNTAFDLAVEQGNETCVNILQDGGWNSGFPQRRAESFLTTIMEDAGQAGPGNSLSYPSDRLSLSSLKEARQYTGPPGTFPQPGGAAPNGAPGPCTQDRSASSFLTECSWQGDTILDLSELTIRTADSPDAFLPPRKLASSCADVQTCWDSQVGRSPSDAGVKQSWDIWASAEEGCSSPPGPDTTLGGPLSLVGSEALSFRPDMVRAAESPQKTLPFASLRSKPEAARLHPPRDANPCGLSQVCVSLDPGLSVRLPSQDGLDVTCLDHLAESTAVSDLGKTVAGPASVLGVSGTLDGCLAGGRSLGRCSATSTDRYLSCISECYASAVEGPGYGYLHGWEGGKAAPSGPAGGCNTSNEGSCCGPPARMGRGLHGQRTLPTRGAARIFPGSQDLALPHSKSTWEVSQRRERSMIGPPENEAPWEGSAWGTQGPTETRGLPVGHQGSALSGAREEMAEAGMTGPRPRLALPTSPWQAGEGQPSSPTQDTIPVQWTSEGRNCFRGCEGPLGPSSTVGGTEVAPGPLASIGEEPLSTLDAQLRSMMLATRVTHSPLLPSNQKCSPAPPWPQRPLVGALPQQSLSTASLFEEPLEMPRRPRRVRRGPGPASTQRAAGLGCSPPPAREAEEVGEGTAVSAVPSCRKTPSNPGPGSWGCFLASSRGDVGRGEESAAGKPSGAREEMAEAGMTGRPRLALPTSPRQAGEGQPSSPTQDTIPVQWTSEGRNCFRGCEGPLGPSSTVGGTEVAPGPLASIGEEPLSTLDAQLRSLMLATRVAHSPLLPSNRKCSPAPPWPQRPLVGALPQQSLSTASLFEEPLEMPRRPRRVRRGPGPASTQRAAGLGCSPPPAREAEEVGEGTAVSAVPSCRKTPSNPGPGSWGCFLASSRGDVGRGEESAAGKPSAGDTAQGYPEVGHLESLGARGSLGKRAEKTSRVSFSRLSGRGPSATSPPGRLSPIRQEVPLSPGGRPANLSATEPVEYLYMDEEKGQSLIERHLPPTDDSGASTSEDTLVYDWRACARAAAGRQGNGECAPLNPEYLTDKALTRKLRELGANPGPVTPLTRRLYVRLLERLSRDPETPTRKGSAVYSPELASALDTYRIPTSKADEGALAAEFDRPDKSRRWREGLQKSSFNYLLLDPRVTQNLPARCQLLSPAEAFQTFIRAIFYVGKGTRSRPYRHLYEALTHYREGQGTPAGPQVSSKVRHTLEIWAGGRGVVSMHCFQNVVPVEAYTREACMVDAIGLKMLTNQKKGNYYGLVAGWPMKRRRSLGVFLLHRALQIFLAEGERQLRPADI